MTYHAPLRPPFLHEPEDDEPFGRPDDLQPGDFTGVVLLATAALLLAVIGVRLFVQVVAG